MDIENFASPNHENKQVRYFFMTCSYTRKVFEESKMTNG